MNTASEIPDPEIGHLYVDKMFRAEVEVTEVDGIGVFIRDTALDGDSKGSPYPMEMWRENVAAGRFKRVDPYLEPSRDDADTPAEEADDPDPASEITPDEFTTTNSLEW